MVAGASDETPYGGFCSCGAPCGVKMGSDPAQFAVVDGRLFIFGDVQGKEFWLLDRDDNIRHADQLWPAIRDKGWRMQSLKAWIFKVPWYRDGRGLMARWRAAHPGRELNYDTGGPPNNRPFQYPAPPAPPGDRHESFGGRPQPAV